MTILHLYCFLQVSNTEWDGQRGLGPQGPGPTSCWTGTLVEEWQPPPPVLCIGAQEVPTGHGWVNHSSLWLINRCVVWLVGVPVALFTLWEAVHPTVMEQGLDPQGGRTCENAHLRKGERMCRSSAQQKGAWSPRARAHPMFD